MESIRQYMPGQILPNPSKKEIERAVFLKTHPPIRCAKCKAGGTMYKVGGEYYCGKCKDENQD